MSAWNDNGQKGKVLDAEKLYRSDFFPGLGWMMTSDMWAELGPKCVFLLSRNEDAAMEKK